MLRSVGGLPPHIVAQFEEPSAFQQSASGEFFLFDRGRHAIYAIDAAATVATRIVDIGLEAGRVIRPGALAVGPADTFIVADAPRRRERIQLFRRDGERLSGFTLPGRIAPRLRLGGIVLNGTGSLQHLGDSLLINLPETGGLITQYSLSGRALRTIGAMRRTGYEDDRDVHLALNSGIPLADPTGGFYFVFQAGRPAFRKYDATGRLRFERHIEGPELDPLVLNLPTTWAREDIGRGEELPVVPIAVRTAVVDPDGRLWVVLSTAYTYVYDQFGDKQRTVQFRGAGPVHPVSLAFDAAGRILVAPGCYVFDRP